MFEEYTEFMSTSLLSAPLFKRTQRHTTRQPSGRTSLSKLWCVCVCVCPSCRCIVSLGQSGRVFTANYCSGPHSHIQLDTKSFRQKKKKKYLSATKRPVISEGTNMKIIPEFHAKSISVQWSRYKTSYHIKESVHRHFSVRWFIACATKC